MPRTADARRIDPPTGRPPPGQPPHSTPAAARQLQRLVRRRRALQPADRLAAFRLLVPTAILRSDAAAWTAAPQALARTPPAGDLQISRSHPGPRRPLPGAIETLEARGLDTARQTAVMGTHPRRPVGSRSADSNGGGPLERG